MGLRGDTTRAPTRGTRPKGAARCRPVFPLRDWHEGGKSTQSVPVYTLPYLPTLVSPFHAEPSQGRDRYRVPSIDGVPPPQQLISRPRADPAIPPWGGELTTVYGSGQTTVFSLAG